MISRTALALCLGLAACTALAADKSDAAKPADADSSYGTTIFGDQETPIGLFITPWKDSFAERGLDRPARFFDEAVEPIDRATFKRQLDYWRELTKYRQAHPASSAPAQP